MRISILIVSALAVLLLQGCKTEETNVTPGGYKYIMHTSTGGEKPKPGDYVYFHAQIRKVDSVLYSSREMGQTPFLQIPTEADAQQPGRIPSPVEEILRMMAVGDSVTVFIRVDTLPNKPPGFENEKEMLYDIVTVEIKSAEKFQQDASAQREQERLKAEAAMQREPAIKQLIDGILKQYKSGALNSKLKTTASGLKYLLLEEGQGKSADGRMTQVHYYGVLASGKMFDNSFSRGQAFAFMPGQGQVIKGWDEGIAMFKEGTKAVLFIPAELGYGASGAGNDIPPNSELVFYVELEKVN